MAARKSVLYLHSVIPVTKTRDDVIKHKLKPGKFVFTIAGNIQIAGTICLLAAEMLALTSTFCNDNDTYKYLFESTVGLTMVISFLLYLIFSFGLTVKKPGVWVKIYIILNLLLSVITIISSILTDFTCTTPGSLNSVPVPLGISGSVILVLCCAAMFLMYRYKEDEDDVQIPRPVKKQLPRKSIFA